MKRLEVIQSVAYITVPTGASRKEHDLPGTGGAITLTDIGPEDSGALEIIAAQCLAEVLNQKTADLGDAADANLLACIHAGLIEFDQQQILADSMIVEGFEDEVKKDHKTRVKQLQKISDDLGIAYTAPEDPLLEG